MQHKTHPKMPILREYLRKQIIKKAGHVKDIFTNADLIRQDRVFNPDMIYTHMYTNQIDKQEDRIPDQQNMVMVGYKNVISDKGMVVDMKPLKLNSHITSRIAGNVK